MSEAKSIGSGVVVIDIDDHRGGLESLCSLERRHGVLPSTFSVVTSHGGTHYYFCHSGRHDDADPLA